MKHLIGFLSVLSLLLLTACKHKKMEMPEPKIYFDGIVETSDTGEYLGAFDASDWRMDDVWTAQESALFPNAGLPICVPIDSLEIYPPAPNPASDRIYLGLRSITGIEWQFRLVDEDFNLLWANDIDNLTTGYNAILTELAGFPKDTLRLYYQATNGSCLWQGHGDIVVTQ